MPKSTNEPIAIIGMACRFPGANDIEAFWSLLEAGGNAVTEGVPGSGVGRWGLIFGDEAVQSEGCRYGAFVDDIEMFDDAFFRISPVEAQLLDPQQRMMLEVTWQALEDAGIDPERIRGSRTGVYSGISNDEYRMLVVDSSKPSEAASCLYALSGTNLNGTAGRVSFVLGLTGPAKAVDAACASAMVAINDAVADLQQGKANLAIAGGVQAILNGRIYELRADAMMLSPDGQCKTFDASANGYVRAEGCGVVVLKRLSEAEADGDRIWAVIRGSVVNHGGTGVGLTVPNTPALEQVMEDALSDAGVDPLEVDYIEAHGTGTTVGDPIEINAVSHVYCRERGADRPLLIGPVKTNVGHLESAAGVVGLIKAALVVKRGVIPKHLHFRDPNPALDWDSLPLRVTTEMMEWPNRPGRSRVAGVNCFGISGTNAHLVVEEYRGVDGDGAGEFRPVGASRPVEVDSEVPGPGIEPRGTRLLPLSGKSEAALRELAGRYLAWLDERDGELSDDGGASGALLSDMAWTAGVGRSHFDDRAGVVFRDAESLREGLEAVAGTGDRPARGTATRIAFAYTGQGSQWVGMGRALYAREPVARAVMDRCEAVFREERGTSLLDVMFGRDGANGDLGDTAWEQPALYTIESALTALWATVGVRPDVVLGHSVGEIAAAQAAGVFGLEDGMRFACTRGALMSGMEEGAMAAVFAPAERVAAAVADWNAASGDVGVGISGDNGAHQVVSGPVGAVEAMSRRFEAEGIRVRRLNTAKAFHSALVDPILDALETSLDGVAIASPALTLVSNLTGRAVGPGEVLDGRYWRRHAREAVAFSSGVRAVADLGVDLLVEIGPRSVLAPMALTAWPEAVEAPGVLASLQAPTADDPLAGGAGDFVRAVAEAYETGLPVRFEGLFAGESRRRIPLPGYPFQRTRHWLDAPRRRRGRADHPLLGTRHESAGGEITFETEVFPAEPAWLDDHRVYRRVVVPGALYGAMAAAVSRGDGSGPVVVEEMQLHNALVFPEDGSENGSGDAGRTLQMVLDASEGAATRDFRIFSKGSGGEWVVHVEGRVAPGTAVPEADGRIDLEGLRARLSPVHVAGYYRARLETGVDLGPSFQTLARAWSGPGEAMGEVAFPEDLGRNELDVHPLVLDGCFQVVGSARNLDGPHGSVTYLPFGWERLWLTTGRLPDRVVCHVLMSDASRAADAQEGEPPEVLTGELRIYDLNGALLGGLDGYTVKRATRAALLSAGESVKDLLYEVVWRERSLPEGMPSADFFPDPGSVKAGARLLAEYLVEAGVDPDDRNALLTDLEHWSWSYAVATLDTLGWQRTAGEVVRSEALREQLGVMAEHSRLFRRMLEMAARAVVLHEEDDGGFRVVVGSGDPWPDAIPHDPGGHHEVMAGRYSHGLTEVGLFRRSGRALAEVLRGREDPLTLLFSSGEPTAADLYLKAPVARAANRMLEVAVQALVDALPKGRRLRVVEVGAGTGSATASVLPLLPEGQFDYMYTDISAGFFAEAEARFGDGGGCIEYRPLDIEKDPVAQGFDEHGYDLLLASNVLHATRYLEETLGHCRKLLAPSGQLVALENLSGLGWMDLTFGQLDGWWRFADDYRPHHALASPAVWRRALGDAGFGEVEVVGVDESDLTRVPDKGVIVARGPVEVREPAGVWVLAADGGGVAAGLAGELAGRNQAVVVVGGDSVEGAGAGVRHATVDMDQRESWRSLLESLPDDVPLAGVAHFLALDGHGEEATTDEMADDVTRVGASALAMVQGVTDSGATPEKGVWFVTRGAQVLERERGGELSGAALWGFGKGVAREAPHLQPRMIDLDPGRMAPAPDLANELLYPDPENHIAYRLGRRRVARVVRAESAGERLALPEESNWVLAPDPGGVFDRPHVQPLPARPLEPHEVRVAVEAAGLNFWDVFRSLGFIEEGLLGREMCGHIIDMGAEVSHVAVGDHVVGMGFGAFGPEMVTHEELVAPAPDGFSVTGLGAVPSAFVSAALSFEFTGLEPGERVLIHAGAGGVGLAAIQWVQAAGAEVFATASAPKQDYLRSLGVEHIFDSRQTAFGEEILEATGGEGVDVVLNSLTSEGFIEASLACLKHGGRFVKMARRDILSYEEMAEVRPDVPYHILELDVVKKTDPAHAGRVLREVMARISTGELQPIVHSRWPLAEAGGALSFMRAARHLGKIVVTTPPLQGGGLRQDGTYLVTGGLGGIGCAVAVWLADRGAGAIVLNGRRGPDAAAEEIIDGLRARGVTVEVELADITDTTAVDRMLDRVDRELPPLAGVIHSVGVLSDGALTNQSWDRFEQVLWPKVLGAWHLHRATLDRDLDMFCLFSSRVGVMGNPGQSNHASANAFLDQLAGHRRALGLAGQAIAWGAWSEIGEAAEQRERIDERRSALGGRWFTPQQGIRAFERLVRQDVTNSVVMAMDWSVFEEAVEERPPLLDELLSTDSEDGEDASATPKDVLSQLGETPTTAHEDLLVSFLQGEVQAVLRLPSAPAPTIGFFDLGMDSLMAVELRNRLNRAFSGVYTAPNTLVFDYPDIASLAAHLAGELVVDGDAPPPAPEAQPEPPPAPSTQAASDAIAIVGMACRFPGAPDLAAFWRQLEAGADLVTDGRTDEGPWHGVAGDPGGTDPVSRRGAFLDDIDKFDGRFFRIPPIEARTMDPRQRLLLETTWHALEDAGIDPAGLRGSSTGAYVGVTSGDYRDLAAAAGEFHGYLGTTPSVTAGRIAFVLGLAGPAVPVDVACASSLAAVHQAVSALRQDDVELTLVGGVNAILHPGVSAAMAEMGLLSKRGRCSTFDAAADGFVRGEGCGVVVLKRLAEAQADGDRIWGVIRGSAVNQNGASAGLTVPNGPAQERVIEEALARAGIAPAEVDYLEANGVGSDLGDPIEVQAAAAVYGRGRDPGRPLLIGSVKTNIGHLECAAGVASLIKAVLAMNEGRIPRQLHFDDPNPHLEWGRLPVRVTSADTEWPSHADRPPRAGVSSFGLSGTNAHVVVEGQEQPDDTGGSIAGQAWPAGPAQTIAPRLPERAAELPLSPADFVPRDTRILPLSAKSPDALRELANRYLDWLDERESVPSANGGALESLLADMAWTAGVGRSHFAHRAGIRFQDAESLRKGLRATADKRQTGVQPGSPEADIPPKLAFAYAGEGGEQVGMGKDIYDCEPVARAVLDRCDAVLREARAGASLLDVMFGRSGTDGRLHDPEWAQPALYALECALTALWASVGIRPAVAVGEGVGEWAAAWAGGVFSLEDGLRLAAARGTAMARPKARVAAAMPAGDSNPEQDPLAELEATYSGIETSPPSLTLLSQATCQPLDAGRSPGWDCWRDQLLAPKPLRRCKGKLAELDVGFVVEIGPHVTPAPIELAAWTGAHGQTGRSFPESAAGVYQAGLPVSFAGLFAGETRRRIPLPGYPFQRERHWIETVG
ncbi:MAG: SDR family NAD(P)-dependent oxidoreductase [Gemmatimonadota bacterium]|nr:SDR family NAD(P)-dependent oxidoreductase [Gemmatimonadota bacterium]MDE2983631.1 SDR family NAD(P)-dependent oxidoreductase [Gemmatimonadota bacterium]